MALHWPTFFTRLGSAIVFCIIMMAGLLWSEWAFFVLVALTQFLCLRDYMRLMGKIYPYAKIPQGQQIVVQVSAVFLLSLFQLYYALDTHALMIQAWPLLVGAILLVKQKEFADSARLQSLAGLLYIAMPMEMLLYLGQKNMLLPLVLILMLWTNDTMAYLVGSFIGRTPFSKISPKKTWEGTIGGAILTIAAGVAFGYYNSELGVIDGLILAICAAAAGTAGDLFESKLKRKADVKDSGKMMPGHGGALDRFDSLLFAAPAAFIYVYLFF
jgi:phosphatidate cytidylyltransferase